jgi:hypothetical protein
VRLGTWVPFERLPELLRHFTGARLSASTIQRLTEQAGAAHEAVQTAAVVQLERACPAPPAGPAVQQVSVDGAMVPLRGPGGKAEWAEVKTLAIGTVVTVTGQPPLLNQAGDHGDRAEQGEKEVHTTELSYFSRMTDHTTFARLATVETHRRGTETAGTVCGVVDGADWCQQFLDTHRPDAVRILDFPHASGYLATVAQAAFGEGTTAAATWYEAQRHALLHAHPDVVLAAVRAVRDDITARATTSPRSPGSDPATATATATTLETVTKSLTYLDKRRDQVHYAAFRAQGYPIGSGIVESANKLVVEARLKGAGMHWAPAHVNPMLALRTVACADRWAEAWPLIVHQVRSQQRATTTARRTARPSRSCATPPPPSLAPEPAATPPPPRSPRPPRAPLSSGPGRPAPNHPWKHAFLTPSRRSLAAHGSHAKS